MRVTSIRSNPPSSPARLHATSTVRTRQHNASRQRPPHHYEWNEWIQLAIDARRHHDECPSMFLDLTGKNEANPFFIVYRLVKEALLKKKSK